MIYVTSKCYNLLTVIFLSKGVVMIGEKELVYLILSNCCSCLTGFELAIASYFFN